MKTYNIKGGVLIVDADFVFRRNRRWRVHTDGYVRDSKTVALHREIMKPPAGMVIDHINGNPLDNRRENLRICEHRQNLWNGRPHRDGSSKYRGVCWSKDKRKWRAQIQGKPLGFFASEDDAAKAYNAAAVVKFGEFVRLNMVPGAGIEPARA